jgi:hypothetical protein
LRAAPRTPTHYGWPRHVLNNIAGHEPGDEESWLRGGDSANDLVVTHTDGTNGTLVKAFVADFLDVPNSNQF